MKEVAPAAPPFFTVFTPTYNRRHTLERVRDSLAAQTCRDFEWVIVDDGSTDNTAALVQGWIAQQPAFPIRYLPQPNQGKHGAYNTATQAASGFALVTVDSDDGLLPDALEKLKRAWDAVAEKERFVGVCGLFQYQNGSIVGDRFPQDGMASNAIDLRYNLRVRGDKIGFNRVDILREHPFPVYQAEHFVPESTVWNRIAQKYQTWCVNLPIGTKEYQVGGLTAKAALNSARNPLAYYHCYAEILNGQVPVRFASTVRCVLTVMKCALLAGQPPLVAKKLRHRLLSLVLLPLATLLVLRDRRRLRLVK